MKTRTFLFGLTILALMVGCSAASSPTTAVKKFYKAVEKNDAKAMAEVATPETVQLMAMLGTKARDMMTSYGKTKSIIVTVTFENGEEKTIDLIKIDGEWKVSMSMEK